MAQAAWRMAGTDLPRLIRASVSGRELIDGGFPRGSGNLCPAKGCEVPASVGMTG